MEAAIADYIAYIQAKYISFVDEFTEGRDFKLQKLIRVSRLHESLSIAYLFLEIAQKRAQDHESDLVNFLGYCLSNLLITARIYSLL